MVFSELLLLLIHLKKEMYKDHAKEKYIWIIAKMNCSDVK